MIAAPAPKRRVPLWAWLGGGGALMLLLLTVGGVALWYVWPFGPQAFTLKVLNAPAGSRVLVDDVDRSGVPQADSTIIVKGLKAGEPREVRIVHEEHEDYIETVAGKGGQISEITYKSPLKETKKPPLSEIDYTGKMMLVPAGLFTMGDNNHQPDEQPAHPVEVPAFYIDKYEVTNEQYKKFCDATQRAYPPSPWWDQQYFNSKPQAPVVGISWDDAAKYAEWAGKRLPTEEEWEKAASWEPKTNRKRQWPWGDTPEQGRANVASPRDKPRLLPVGQNPSGASAYGVHDMSGNAAEWVGSHFQPYEGNKTQNPEFGTTNRVIRGGTCISTLDNARTTRRASHPPDYTAQEKATGNFLVGFRCAVAAGDAKLREHLSKARSK
jgi:formylglycine-generating enzyme required for sulfatase activity